MLWFSSVDGIHADSLGVLVCRGPSSGGFVGLLQFVKGFHAVGLAR